MTLETSLLKSAIGVLYRGDISTQKGKDILNRLKKTHAIIPAAHVSYVGEASHMFEYLASSAWDIYIFFPINARKVD